MSCLILEVVEKAFAQWREHVNPYGLFPLDLSTRLLYLHKMVA